MNETNDCDFLR